MLHELNPFVRHARQQTFYHRQPYDRRAVDYHLFFTFTHELEIWAAGTKYLLRPDTMMIIPPHTTYNLAGASSPKAKFAVIDFELTPKNKNFCNGIAPYVGDTPPVQLASVDIFAPFDRIFLLENAKFAKNNLLSIIGNFVLCEPLYREFSSLRLKEILLNCHRVQVGIEKPLSPHVIKAIDYLRTRFATPISNAELSLKLGYSAGYLNECFKRELGITLHAYLVQIRLKNACFLLETVDSTVAEIASRCGFQSHAYFSAMFRRAYGQSPQSYRTAKEGIDH